METMQTAGEVVQGFVDEVILAGKLDRLSDFVHDDVKIDSLTGVRGQGLSAALEAVTRWKQAFEVISNETLYDLTDGVRIVHHWRCTARHVGEFLGQAPSHAELVFSGVTQYTVEDGKLSAIGGYTDFLTPRGRGL